MSFRGKRVLSLESRRANETAELIRRNGGEPFVAPALREVPTEENPAAFEFAERLIGGEFEMVIFLTGVGTRYLTKLITTKISLEQFTEALRRTVVVARGPKPAAALRELGVPVTVGVPEPNTWREILAAIEGRPERRVAVQEYGRPASELLEALEARGFIVTAVPVYKYALPDDVAPLRKAVLGLAQESFDIAFFTTSQQVANLIDMTRQMELEAEVRQGIARTFIASIGPTTSETLREYGFEPDLEPSHPKLGFLVKETAEHFDSPTWIPKT